MRIYIGADHNGFAYKQQIIDFLQRSGHEVVDIGARALNQDDDFPEFAIGVVNGVLGDRTPGAFGLLICGSGQGMVMAANRFKGIRASLCWNVDEARAARNDDDSNVLCLSSRYQNPIDEQAIVSTFLATPFAGAPRFVRRLEELDRLG